MSPRSLSLVRRLAAGALAAAALVALTACGSSNSSTASASGNTANATPAANTSSIVSTCQSMIDQAKQPLTFTPPGPAFSAAKLKGKHVMFLSLDQAVPAIAQDATATQQAGRLLGINVSVFDTKGTVTLMQQGIQQAIAQKFDAIILLGIPLKVTANALTAAHNAGITIVSELNNEPVAGSPGQGAGADVFGSTGPPRFKTGQLLACKAVTDTAGKATTVIFGDKSLEPSAAEVAGMKDILSKCSGCSVSVNDTPTAQWQTALPGLAGSEVRRNPNANYFLPLYDGMGIFVTSGVQQAGAAGRVKVASFNATPAALKLIQNGNVFAGDPGQPNSWMAWQGLDQAMRGMLKLAPGNPVVPVRFFDRQNLTGVNADNEASLFGNDYQAGFKKIWGL